MATIRFELRADKTDKDGKAPIRIVYQISGQRKFYPTTHKCYPANWDVKSQKAVYVDRKTAKKVAPGIDYNLLLSEREAESLNVKLAGYKKDIEQVETRFRLDGITYTPEKVIGALHAFRNVEEKKDDPEISVPAFIDLFVIDSGGTHKPGTLKVYSGLANHIREFEKVKRQKATFEKLDFPFLKAFHTYLSENKGEVKGMNNITAAKQISTLKTLLNYARTEYKIQVNPDYRDYKVSRKDGDFEVITITYEEFLKLYNFDLSNNKKLDQIRDVFCFSCTTGLRFSDLIQLKREHIRGSVIKMTAAKTGQRLEIPLNPFSAAILKKYNEMHRPLPVISNQKTNTYLKELCRKAEINTPIEVVRDYGVRKVSTIYPKHECISIHTGRKTFTTLSLEKGIAAQEVMAITGHTTYKAFKRYVDVTSKRKQAVMAQAWGEVKENKLKAI